MEAVAQGADKAIELLVCNQARRDPEPNNKKTTCLLWDLVQQADEWHDAEKWIRYFERFDDFRQQVGRQLPKDGQMGGQKYRVDQVTALHVACENAKWEVAKMLLKMDASAEAKDRAANKKDSFGRTPLFLAATQPGAAEAGVIRMLLDQKDPADLDDPVHIRVRHSEKMRKQGDGWSLLHACAVSCDVENFRELWDAMDQSKERTVDLEEQPLKNHTVAVLACGCRCGSCRTPGIGLYPHNNRVSPHNVVAFLRFLKKMDKSVDLRPTIGTVVRREEEDLFHAFLEDKEFSRLFYAGRRDPPAPHAGDGAQAPEEEAVSPEGLSALQRILQRWPEGLICWLAGKLPLIRLDQANNNILHLAIQHCDGRTFEKVVAILQQTLPLCKWFRLLKEEKNDAMQIPMQLAQACAFRSPDDVQKHELLMQKGGIHALLFDEPSYLPQSMLQPMPALVFFDLPGNDPLRRIDEFRRWYLRERVAHAFLILYLGDDLDIVQKDGAGHSQKHDDVVWFGCPKDREHRDRVKQLLNMQKALKTRVYRFDKNWKSQGHSDIEQYQDLKWLSSLDV